MTIDVRSIESGPGPISERTGRLVVTNGAARMEIDPLRGARIYSFSLEGRDVLTGPDVDPDNYGSTFWTSPQADWGWPPPPEIDNQPYTVVETDSGFVCAGTISPKLGVLVTKRFETLSLPGAIAVEYSVHNQGATPLRLAPWEISRVAGGLTLFAAGEGRFKHATLPEPEVREEGGIVWYQYARERVTCDQKLFTHSREGWLAHVRDGLALIKQFTPIALADQAPEEGAIEIFASGLKDYIEIEQQGAYAKLEGWKSSVWRVNWLLTKLPSGIKAEAGNTALARWVQAQVALLKK